MKPDHPFVPWALAVAATAAVLLAGRAVAVDPSDLWDQRINQRLAAMPARADIAAVGTCLIQPILGVSGELERDAAAAGMNVSVVRLLRPGRDWDWEPIVEALLERPPRVTIIEMPVLVRNLRPPTRQPPGMIESLQQVRSAALAVVSAAPRLPTMQDVREAWWRRDVAVFETGTWPIARLDAADIELARMQHFHEPDRRAIELLRALAGRSRAVVAVELPHHPSHPVAAAHQQALDRINRMLRDAGVRIVTSPEVGASGFLDRAHLNPAGAAAIRGALVQELAAFPAR